MKKTEGKSKLAIDEIKRVTEKLKEFDLSKRKQLLVEKQLLLKQKEAIDISIRNITGQLSALDRYLLNGDKT